ncbi:hypothetical protein [Poriferisphaera corsica]|nr:hypothetical protein [Poriferisphaera corsica]
MPHYLHRETMDTTKYWFGEENQRYVGPGSTMRKLDLADAILASFLSGAMDERIVCPDFPYDADGYFEKFDKQAASYGMNAYVTGVQYTPISLCKKFNLPITPYFRITQFFRTSEIVMFADGVHLDGLGDKQFNDAIYLKVENQFGGFAHFRHHGKTNVSYLDGHARAEGFETIERMYEDIGGDGAGNLTHGDYGMDTPYGSLE